MTVRLFSTLFPVRFTPNAIVGLMPRYVVRVIPDRTNAAKLDFVKQSPLAEEISHFGAGMIRGTVTMQGTPGRARVAALTECAPNAVASAWSDAETGRFTFYPLILTKKYIIIGLDPGVRFDVAAHGQIAPVPWEDENE